MSGRSGKLVLILFVRGFFFIDAQLQSLEQRARCLNHSQGQHLAYVRSEERYKCFFNVSVCALLRIGLKRDKAALTARYAASHGADLEEEDEDEAFEEALSNVVEENMPSQSQRVAERKRAAALRAEERQRRADVAAEATAADDSRQKPNQVIPPALRK